MSAPDSRLRAKLRGRGKATVRLAFETHRENYCVEDSIVLSKAKVTDVQRESARRMVADGSLTSLDETPHFGMYQCPFGLVSIGRAYSMLVHGYAFAGCRKGNAFTHKSPF